MIKNINILDQNGILLYSINLFKGIYDSDLFIGFFTSIVNFSREALNSVIRNIKLDEENKLILYTHEDEKLIVAAIVNSNDNNATILSILEEFIQDFINLYNPDYNLESIDHSKLNEILDTY